MQTTEGEKPAKQVFQMEWRQCPGCPQEFKVLTTSKQVYHSKACEIQSGGVSTTPIKKQRPWESLERDRARHGAGKLTIDPPSPAYEPVKTKPTEIEIELVERPASVEKTEPVNETASHRQEDRQELEVFESLDPQVVETPQDSICDLQIANRESDPIEERWQSYVDRGRSLISAMARDRLAVAELAFEACEIVRGGGGHWRDFEGTYTMTKFAADIGIAYKTLANWVRVKRNVYDKLLSIGEEIDPTQDWAAMTRVADRCKIEDTPEQVLKKFRSNSQKKKGPFNQERYFLQGLRRVRSLNHFLTEHNPKKKTFDAEDLRELKALCKSIGRWIDS